MFSSIYQYLDINLFDIQSFTSVRCLNRAPSRLSVGAMSYPSDSHPPYLSCPSPRSSPRLAPSSNIPRPSSSLSSSTASNNSNHGDSLSHHGGGSSHHGDSLSHHGGGSNHRGDPGGRVFLSPQLGRKNLLRKQTSIDYRVKNRLTVESGLESRSRSYDNLYQPRPSSREGLSRDFGGGLTRDMSRGDPVITSREVAQRVMRPDKHSPLPPRVNFSPKGPKKAL
eukprot:sb/3469711/